MLVFSSTGDSKSQPRRRLQFSRKQVVVLLLLLATTFSVRILTFMFMRAHLHDPSWFQTGSYGKFDRQARDIIDGRQNLFLITDPTRTDLVQYPPAYPWLVALIYKASGVYTAYRVQIVQWLVDLFVSMILITGIAVTAFGWRAAVAASFLAGLSPLLAMYGAWPSADTPTMWFVLGGNWALLVAAKRSNLWFAFIAGLLLGMACWFRVNPLYLTVGWGFVLAVFLKGSLKWRLAMSGAVVLGTVLLVAPIVIRNYLSFPDFTPTGGTIGTNLWEGLGETELGRQHGFMFGDDKLVERERQRMGLPADFPLEPQWPDGIRRDNERIRESLAFIKQHPWWYAGVMLKRMWGMLKVAGDPLPYYASNGINVTSRKCLPENWQGGVVGLVANLLGMIQSVVRYLLLPLVVLGIYVACRLQLTTTVVLVVTILYYLIPGTFGHTEMRYMLPMHALLIIFGGVGLDWLLLKTNAVIFRSKFDY